MQCSNQSGFDRVHAGRNRCGRIFKPPGLPAQKVRTRTDPCNPDRARPDLVDIAEAVIRIDQDPVRVAHVADSHLRIGHAGNMDEARQRRKQFRLAGKVMVERVMHEFEPALPANRLDCLGRLALGTQRTDLEPQRLDEADEPAVPRGSASAPSARCAGSPAARHPAWPEPSLTGTSTSAARADLLAHNRQARSLPSRAPASTR